MAQKIVAVGAESGLHARLASTIAEVASKFDAEIILELVDDASDAEPAEAASSLLVLALGAEKGDTISVTSPDAAAVEKIASLIEGLS